MLGYIGNGVYCTLALVGSQNADHSKEMQWLSGCTYHILTPEKSRDVIKSSLLHSSHPVPKYFHQSPLTFENYRMLIKSNSY